MSPERKLAEGMGYEHCVLFPAARMAVRAYVVINNLKAVFLPSNICPALANAVGPAAVFMPVGAKTGLSRPCGGVVVQLYGARQEYNGHLDIDPLMTGWKRKPCCTSAIVSFGYSKTVDIGGGGAFLTNDGVLALQMKPWAEWPDELTEPLDAALDKLDGTIAARWQQWRYWMDSDSPFFEGGPEWTPVIPWRAIRLVDPFRRAAAMNEYSKAGYFVGTNYPPLPGCTDPSSVEWGRRVINIWR